MDGDAPLTDQATQLRDFTRAWMGTGSDPEYLAERSKNNYKLPEGQTGPPSVYKQPNGTYFSTGGDDEVRLHARAHADQYGEHLKKYFPQLGDEDISNAKEKMYDKTFANTRAFLVQNKAEELEREGDAGLTAQKYMRWIPFGRMGYDIGKSADAYSAGKAFENGEATPGHYITAARQIASQRLDAKKNFGDKLVDTVSGLAPMAAEWAMLGGPASAASKAAAAKLGGGLLGKAGGVAAFGGVQTLGQAPGRVPAGMLQRAAPNVYIDPNGGLQTKEGEPLGQAAMKELASEWISNTAFSVANPLMRQTGQKLLTRLAMGTGYGLATVEGDAELQKALGLQPEGSDFRKLMDPDPEVKRQAAQRIISQMIAFGALHGAHEVPNLWKAGSEAAQAAEAQGLPHDPAKLKEALEEHVNATVPPPANAPDTANAPAAETPGAAPDANAAPAGAAPPAPGGPQLPLEAPPAEAPKRRRSAGGIPRPEAAQPGVAPQPADRAAGDQGGAAAGAVQEPATGAAGQPAGASAPAVPAGGPRVLKPLPRMEDNYRKPLSEYTNRLYRESDIPNATRFIEGGDSNLQDLYFSNTPELATGQGKNKGIMLEFDPGHIQGQVNLSKPGSDMAYSSGMAEFLTRHHSPGEFPKLVRAITVKPDAVGDKASNFRLKRILGRLEEQGWQKVEQPDGATRYVHPLEAEAVPKALTFREQATNLEAEHRDLIGRESDLQRRVLSLQNEASVGRDVREELRQAEGGLSDTRARRKAIEKPLDAARNQAAIEEAKAAPEAPKPPEQPLGGQEAAPAPPNAPTGQESPPRAVPKPTSEDLMRLQEKMGLGPRVSNGTRSKQPEPPVQQPGESEQDFQKRFSAWQDAREKAGGEKVVNPADFKLPEGEVSRAREQGMQISKQRRMLAPGMGAASGTPESEAATQAPGTAAPIVPERGAPSATSKPWYQKIADFAHSFAQKTYPSLTRISRRSGEALAEASNSRGIADRTWDYMSNVLKAGGKRLADMTPDERREIGAVWAEMRFRHYRDVLNQSGEDSSNVRTLVGQEGSPIKTEAEYQDGLGKLWSFFQAIRQEWTPEVEANYRGIMGLEPDEEINSRSQVPTLPLNMIPIQEGEQAGAGIAKTGFSNQRIRKPTFTKTAELNAPAYDIDIGHMMERTLQTGVAAKNRAQFVRTAIEDGVVKVVNKGERAPEGFQELMLRPSPGLPELPSGSRYFAHPDAFNEIVQGLQIGKTPAEQVFGTKQALGLGGRLTQVAIAAPAELLTHVGANIPTALWQEGMGTPVVNAKKWITNAIDTWRRDPEMMRKIMDLAKISAAFEKREPTGILGKSLEKYDPTYYVNRFTTKLIDTAQDAIRVQLGEAYDEMVKSGRKPAGDTFKRDFINQGAGNYNNNASNSLIQLVKQTGLQPFATAASTFTTQSVKAGMGYAVPNAPNASAGAALQGRALQIAKILPLFVAGPALNYAIWGQAFPKGIPPFAIKTREDSVDEETGKTKSHYTDPLAWPMTPNIRRGLRSYGANAVMEGVQQGKTAGQIADRAVGDIKGSAIHTFAGPPAEFASVTLSGKNLYGHQVAPIVSTATTTQGIAKAAAVGKPAPGSSQTWENLKAALANVNPFSKSIYSGEWGQTFGPLGRLEREQTQPKQPSGGGRRRAVRVQ